MEKVLNKCSFFLFCMLAVFSITACDLVAAPEGATVVSQKKKDVEEKELLQKGSVERKWNLFIYMSADNNLESAALEDLCEMESSKLDTEAVSVFLLLDRSASYDTSENNWSGTRLYKLKTGRSESDKFSISEEIECPDLDLEVGKNTELDMSSGYVLSKSIHYVMEKFPADNYGFIMWGHGTGWRSENSGLYKGFAFDDTSKTYMTLKQFGNAVKTGLDGKKFSFIGFDTCFGGELEIAYELRNCGDYFAGSEGLVMASGWDYCNLFNLFQRCSDKTAVDLCKSVSSQFKKQYVNTSRAAIVTVNMKYLNEYVSVLDKYFCSAADLITSTEIRNSVMGKLYTNNDAVGEVYTYGTEKSDVYLDVGSVVSALEECFPAQLQGAVGDVRGVENNLFLETWASDRDKGGLGLYFSTLTSSGLLSTVHPSSYIKNKTYDQIDFVLDTEGYVPTSACSGSLIDKLFYAKF